MSLHDYLWQWGARFDRLALQAPATSEPVSKTLPAPPDLRRQMLAWCHAGDGPGNSPWWAPGALPEVQCRLAVAHLQAHDATLATTWADTLARQIDGSDRLDDCRGRPGAALALRLGVKLADVAWWRHRRMTDPWDAGWARPAGQGPHRLGTAFAPRRATLILAARTDADRLAPALSALAARSPGLRHPVRWLWVGASSNPGAMPLFTPEARS